MGGSFKLTEEFENRFYTIRHLPPKFKSFDELSGEKLMVRIQKIKDIFKLI